MRETPNLDFSSVLASSVHDMKNSLSMLLHSLEEIGMELSGIDSPIASRLATLQYEAARVNNDLVQLLSLYKLDQKVLSPNIDEHNVLDMLEEEVSRYQPLFQAKDVSCELLCEADLSGYFDRDLLAGVMGNVLANTIRYCRRKILVSGKAGSDGCIIIQIEDDGRGFPERMLQQDIEMNTATNFQTGSTNLGLYFAKQIALLHRQNEQQGTVNLSNGGSLGGGVFTITLP
jgi:signal transduction histidine kinase